MSAINSLAPVKQARIKQRTEPWIDSDILALINQRNTAFEQNEQSKTEEHLNIFRSLRNKTQITISKAKQNVFTQKLEENKHDSETLQQHLKQIGLPSKKGSSSKTNITKKIISEKFNHIYTTVASTLVEKLQNSVNKFGVSFV